MFQKHKKYMYNIFTEYCFVYAVDVWLGVPIAGLSDLNFSRIVQNFGSLKSKHIG